VAECWKIEQFPRVEPLAKMLGVKD